MHNIELNKMYSQIPLHHQNKRTTNLSYEYNTINKAYMACGMAFGLTAIHWVYKSLKHGLNSWEGKWCSIRQLRNGKMLCKAERIQHLSIEHRPDCRLTPGSGCSKGGYRYPPDKSLPADSWFVLLTLVHWIAIFLVDNVIQLLNTWAQESEHDGPR